METKAGSLIDRLEKERSLSITEYEYLIIQREDIRDYAAERADLVRKEIYGNKVYTRGLIEISNICRNDCLYCGIRRSNESCDRYRLSSEEILSCAEEGYRLGYRTFVLQGGEDGYFSDEVLVPLIGTLKERYPDCAITLSLGERSKMSYERLFEAGADRYLLRHETATKSHYMSLHPDSMSYENRMECLRNLMDIGYQTGCGFMVGSPGQTEEHLARDLKFIEELSPHMCGIGPFISQKDTPFRDEKDGSVELTVFLLSLIRLIKPNILLPATTALGTLDEEGREKGILAGANVVMPNLSPMNVRDKYALYDGKIHSGAESAQAWNELEERMNKIGFTLSAERGDMKI